MCGLNGILRLAGDAPALDRHELEVTRDAMASRGPDGAGLWLSPDGRIGLAHRRLAIIDLSEGAGQPMHSIGGRFALVFNGEIYNYRELRGELEARGQLFRTQSDSEVLLALLARDGPAGLPRLRGMYALALWDARERRLLLARDPFGVKPLYYAVAGGMLRFASQVKALEAGGAVPGDVDPAGLVGFLLWGSVPEPFTLRHAVRAIPAGHFLEVRDGLVGAPQPHPRGSGADEPHGPDVDLVAAIEDSVRAHLVSDVPVGVFLSAGLDSALLAALARRLLRQPPTTFTLTFEEFADTDLDEGPGAEQVARELGTRHEARRASHEELRELWPAALAAMDQPSIDGFNVFVVSHFAHAAGLKVVLSGLGGDELFGSYPSFADVPRWARLGRLGARLPGGSAVWSVLARLAPGRPKLRGFFRHAASLPGAYFLRRGLFLPEELPALLDHVTVKQGLAAYDAVADAARHADPEVREADEWLAVQRMETGHYLRNQLLRDADWASMAHSLELRVPFVDPRLSAAVAAAGFEPARSGGKAALVRRAAPELPEAVLRRAKSGFMLPYESARRGRFRWGHGARLSAALVLRHFGVELDWPERRRGGTVFLLT